MSNRPLSRHPLDQVHRCPSCGKWKSVHNELCASCYQRFGTSLPRITASGGTTKSAISGGKRSITETSGGSSAAPEQAAGGTERPAARQVIGDLPAVPPVSHPEYPEAEQDRDLEELGRDADGWDFEDHYALTPDEEAALRRSVLRHPAARTKLRVVPGYVQTETGEDL